MTYFIIKTNNIVTTNSQLIEILTKTDKTIEELLDGIVKYYSTKELKINVSDDLKFSVIKRVEEYCTNNDYRILTIDGVKAIFEDGFALVRASNTSPCLTCRFEAKTEYRLKEIEQEFTNIINEYTKK